MIHSATQRRTLGSLRTIIHLLVCAHLFHAKAVSGSPERLTEVPSWAADVVWYQIFPERFRNGDPSNDPGVTDLRGSWPHDDPGVWQVSSWTGDWYRLQEWEVGKDFYYRAQQRRYGGDLQGVIDKLDYLQSLGITALYFNPIFEAPSLHKYDATMYHHIDDNFGPDPQGDREIWKQENPSDPKTWKWTSADKLFLKLLSEAHKRNMKVIIDGVFNHVGMTHWAFVDVQQRADASPYKDWFHIKKWDDPSTPKNEFDYEGWNGVRELPEIREDENGIVAGPREHIHDIVRRWMDPNGDGNPADGIDGWRLDVAEMVAIPFWREFRIWVREINPEAYIVGEVWWEDWKNDRMFNAEPWLRGDVFDAVMNYRVAREVGHFFKDRTKKISASQFDSSLAVIRSDYRPAVTYGIMNMLGSHDTDRLASQIVNPDTRYDGNVNVRSNPNYDVRKPTGDEYRRQMLIALFHMTYVGAPTVYYGDEVGMWGADDPDERKPMLWADMKYDDEASHPLGKERPRDKNEVHQELLVWYSALIHLRNSRPSLRRGDFRVVLVDDQNDCFGFMREYKGEQTLVLINNSSGTQSVRPKDLPAGVAWTDLMNDKHSQYAGPEFSIGPCSGLILGSKPQ